MCAGSNKTKTAIYVRWPSVLDFPGQPLFQDLTFCDLSLETAGNSFHAPFYYYWCDCLILMPFLVDSTSSILHDFYSYNYKIKYTIDVFLAAHGTLGRLCRCPGLMLDIYGELVTSHIWSVMFSCPNAKHCVKTSEKHTCLIAVTNQMWYNTLCVSSCFLTSQL